MLDRDKFENVYVAFRALDEDWARHGKGSRWITPQPRDAGEDTQYTETYLQSLRDARISSLEALLTTEIEQWFTGRAHVWLVLEFVGAYLHVALPVELFRSGRSETLAQVDLEQQSSTGSDQTLTLASGWLQNCVANHPMCRSIYHDSHWLPTRLVFVGTIAEPELRLVLGKTLASDTTYVTLSHCWGESIRPTAQSSSFEALANELPLEMFSQTMLDAVYVARKLGYQYIWIDSLCIFQDDAKDWETESAMMSKVYGFSSCTLAAACSTDGNQGLFRQRDQYRIRPLKITNPFDKASRYPFQIMPQYLSSIYQDCVKQSVWHDRSWVFQERLLSQRMIIFADQQVIWTCQNVQAAESCPQGKTSQYFIDRFESFEVEKLRLHAMLKDDAMQRNNQTGNPWHVIVSAYTKTTTTRNSDRLVALQGIADRIAQAVKYQYIYGLWCDETFLGYLLWYMLPTDISKRPVEYRCPSWSWGSIDGPIQFHQNFQRYDYHCVQKHGLDVRQSEDVDLFATRPVPIRIKAPKFSAFLEIRMSDKTFLLHRSYPHIEQEETRSVVSLNLCSIKAVRYLREGPSSTRSPSIESEASESDHESQDQDHTEAQPETTSTQREPTTRFSRLARRMGAMLSPKQRKEMPLSAQRKPPHPPPRYVKPLEPPLFRTRSMDDGTAYGNDFERFVLDVKEPKPKPDPTVMNASCYLDTTSHNDNVVPVTCLVLARSISEGKVFGLLLRPGPSRMSSSGLAAEQGLPRFQRIGMFSCADQDPAFVDLGSKTQELHLI